MTATAPATTTPTSPPSPGAPPSTVPPSPSPRRFVGTVRLVRWALRRDRLRLSLWLLGSTALLVYLVGFVTEVVDAGDAGDLARFMEGSVGAVFGPGYGHEQITAERYVAGVYGLVFFVLAALMSSFLVSRHTRAEEETGRAELVRAGVVGRDAPLVAALVVVVGADLALGLLLATAMTASGAEPGGALLFGASVGAVGLVFAGITAVTVQLVEHARTATGITGVLLGAAWATRFAGDLADEHGSLLSWLSPLAWSNQTRPFVDGRWWPLLLSVGVAVGTAAIGLVLSTRRDLGAGLVAARPGRSEAPGLRSPLRVALRLQRSSVGWWLAALATFGLLVGGLAEQVTDPEDMSEERLEAFGGTADTLVEGFLGVTTLLAASLVAVMAVRAVHGLRSEELGGRAEAVLATSTSRWAWMGSHLAVTSAAVFGVLLLVGAVTGTAVAVSVGERGHLGDVVAAHVAHAPGVLVLVGLAALLFGVRPRVMGVLWPVLALGVFVALFGSVADVPGWLRAVVPVEHTGQPPLDEVSWTATCVLLVVASVLAAAGLVGFRRRDLETR